VNWREKLLNHRRRLKMSQAELGAAIGLQQSRIGRWETGDGMPTMDQGFRLARALGVPFDYLVDDAQQELPAPELSDDERAVLRLMRVLSLNADEALRRLATAVPLPVHGVAAPLAARDETAHDVRLERERVRPRPTPRRIQQGKKPSGRAATKSGRSRS
jgi:transcriptional regulator with XRE-family HTH domain